MNELVFLFLLYYLVGSKFAFKFNLIIYMHSKIIEFKNGTIKNLIVLSINIVSL